MKTHRIEDYEPTFQPAYLANGLVGLRLGANPLCGGKALCNGFVGRQATVSHEGYNPAPYPLSGNVIVGDVELVKRPDLCRFVSQAYDFACGELTTELLFETPAAAVRLEIVTFCSRTLPPVVAQAVRLTVDRPCRLVFETRLDPQGVPGRALLRKRLSWCADSVLWWEGREALSTCGVAFACEFQGEGLEGERRNDWGLEEDLQLTAQTIAAVPDTPCVVEQRGAIVPSVMHEEPHWQAARMVEAAGVLGFAALREENRHAWAELWQARPVLVGAQTRWQDVADAAFFYLHSTVHPSMPASVAPFGLSDEFNYHGHVFWDTEGWMFPATLMTDPGSAQAMLEYRFRLRDGAYHQARLNGYRGLQFPCQTANRGGEMATLWARGGFGVGATLGVAQAFVDYVHATGDTLFERDRAWPIVHGVAEWIVSRVGRTNRGFEVGLERCGDEQWLAVRNTAPTAWHMRHVLREATAMAKRLGYAPPALWTEIAENLYFPIDPATQVLLKFEGWEDTSDLCGMEALMLYAFTTDSLGDAVDRATLDYYLDRVDKYLGMPMFSTQLAVLVARHRGREAATAALEKGLLSRLRPPFLQFCENSREMASWNSTDSTVFVTSTASVVQTLLWLMPGLVWGPGEPATWCCRPPALPAAWDAIEVERLWVRGRPFRLRARQGAAAAELVSLDTSVQGPAVAPSEGKPSGEGTL